MFGAYFFTCGLVHSQFDFAEGAFTNGFLKEVVAYTYLFGFQLFQVGEAATRLLLSHIMTIQLYQLRF